MSRNNLPAVLRRVVRVNEEQPTQQIRCGGTTINIIAGGIYGDSTSGGGVSVKHRADVCPSCSGPKLRQIQSNRSASTVGLIVRLFFALLMPPPLNVLLAGYCIYAWGKVSYVWWCRRCNWQGDNPNSSWLGRLVGR